LPTDSRFLQCSYQKYPPSTTVEADEIIFDLNRFETASLYQIQNTCLEVVCKITKADGTLPAKTVKVWPSNNVLHSLFSIVRVSINEQPIVKQPDNYQYKALFASLFSYSDEFKNAQLASVGYYKDISGHMDDFGVNTGAQQRNRLFRKNGDDDEDYRSEGVKFFGRLQLDLVSLDCGIPPGTKVQIQLVKSPSKFVLNREKTDKENYRIQIVECYLYVPIAQVSAPIYNEISSVLARKSVSLHFRKTEIRPLSIPRNKEDFYSESLFPDDIPCRDYKN